MSEALRRVTRQRSAIQDALDDAEGFRSAQQLHEDLRTAGHRVGLTTVYRELQNLSAAGEIDSLAGPDGEVVYRRCATRDHHHHLLCRSCGLAVEVASDEIESWADRMSSSHGFKEVSHTLELYGLCARCQEGSA
ncbi:MAG: Fur family transcriptional regulator [Actinomycetota bacterium]